MTTVRLDGAAVQKQLSGPQGPVVRDVMGRATNVQSMARNFVRKDTHDLTNSIVKRPVMMGTTFAVNVGVFTGRALAYALYEHDGTEPHEIVPRTKKALAFQIGGRTVIVKRVRHPGTTGSKFLLRALPYASAPGNAAVTGSSVIAGG